MVEIIFFAYLSIGIYMNSSLKSIPENFTVEQAFTISNLFFCTLWNLVEPRVSEEERTGFYSLFFETICMGFEQPCAEWNEAVYRFMKIPKEKQRNLKLTLEETFPCAIELCKHHNERYENGLSYAVQLLESMKKNPELYRDEWKCWNIAINDTVQKYMNDNSFDWSSQLPTWPDNKSNPMIQYLAQ